MSWIITVNGWGSVGQDATAPLVKIPLYADAYNNFVNIIDMAVVPTILL